MKASELRIGNFIYSSVGPIEIKKIDDYNNPFVVLGLFTSHDGNQGVWACENEESLLGIPLTEEWLLKFGYKRQEWYEENIWQSSPIPDVNLHKTERNIKPILILENA